MKYSVISDDGGGGGDLGDDDDDDDQGMRGIEDIVEAEDKSEVVKERIVLRIEEVEVGSMDLEGILREVLRIVVVRIRRGYEVRDDSSEVHSEVHNEVHEHRQLIEPLGLR